MAIIILNTMIKNTCIAYKTCILVQSRFINHFRSIDISCHSSTSFSISVFSAFTICTIQVFIYITGFITFAFTSIITPTFVNQFFIFTSEFVTIPTLFSVQTLPPNLHLHPQVSCKDT